MSKVIVDPNILRLYYRVTNGKVPEDDSKWTHEFSKDCLSIRLNGTNHKINIYEDRIAIHGEHAIAYVQMGGDVRADFIQLQKGMSFESIYAE